MLLGDKMISQCQISFRSDQISRSVMSNSLRPHESQHTRGLIFKVFEQFMQFNTKKKKSSEKLGKRLKQTFLQRRHTDVQQTHEKILNITNYQRNANQNYNEVLLHSGQNGHHQKIQTINAGEDVEKREPPYTVGGKVNWQRHYEEWYGGSSRN